MGDEGKKYGMDFRGIVDDTIQQLNMGVGRQALEGSGDPLAAGSYRFRTLADGTNYWSGDANHCTVPGCSSAWITAGP